MDSIMSAGLLKITYALLIYGFCSKYNLDTEGMVVRHFYLQDRCMYLHCFEEFSQKSI